MIEHVVTFSPGGEEVAVPTGALLVEAARRAGVEIAQPCGGQGRCGRCAVQVEDGELRRRSTLRLSREDVARGVALACQSVVEDDVVVRVLPQEQIERRLTTDLTVAEVTPPADYEPARDQTIKRIALTLPAPSLDDQRDDFSRLLTELRRHTTVSMLRVSLPLLQRLGGVLRADDWRVTIVYDLPADAGEARLIALLPGHVPADKPLWGAAIDIGTTTVSLWLVDLLTGQVTAQAAEYNRQISRGEDVISRIIYASKANGSEPAAGHALSGSIEMRALALETINGLLERVCRRAKIEQSEIVKATVVGNSTMMHLFLGIPAASIRLLPFVTAINHPSLLTAQEVGLLIDSEATVDCLPGVASYVGADISAGALSSGMTDSPEVSLFMDIGTNGETVLGSSDWLVTCACSAGPAFEGAGVLHGMRATRGAIEEVWIDGHTYEPTYRAIGNAPPRGLCGSGLISLLAELFLTGIVDKGGHFNLALPTDRLRTGDHGNEYVIAWGAESQHGRDIVITSVDLDNLLRAKAAIYAGFTVLADAVGVPLDAAERVLIGGAFGKYINVEKAVQIGLLPDMPWDRFHFLGNTAVKGAYLGLLDQRLRERIAQIASHMTYIELSADNSFYDAFTSALFLPHTDLERFPSVVEALVTEVGAVQPGV